MNKTKSIARRIARSFRWKQLRWLISKTLALGLAAFAAWCLAAYQMLNGSLGSLRRVCFALSPERPVSWTLIRRALAGESVFGDYLRFGLDGEAQTPMGDFLFWLLTALLAYFVLHIIAWLFSGFGAIRKVRRYLSPIDDMAQVTESISASGLNESKFHTLEAAIDHLNENAADERLHLGDADLAGLETAVNNLILRMHRAYRQQVRFVDDASHELRTPIAVIAGYADMLERWGKSDPQVLDESIHAIRTETGHMKKLVEQLLFLARGDAGRQTLDRKELDLCALMREVWEESRMIDDRHEYILKAEGSLPCRADEALLKQAVRILVDNAVKYSPENSRITLRAFAEDDSLCLAVQDNGIGVSAEDAERMFDRFYRADRARSSETGGSGLGLSIADWIVQRHGGSFRVKSHEELGTCVTIVLPAGA